MIKDNKWLVYFILLVIGSCVKLDLIDPVGFDISVESDSIVFAEIGDFGSAGDPERKVADMVKSWNPDFIISGGDNNYSDGKLSTIKRNISQYYGDYIYNYDAPFDYWCNGKAFVDGVNRFFPTPGNHDANNRDKLVPYFNFFTLPDNESNYKFIWGSVTFFSLNTVEGDLNDQKVWLERELSLVTTPFRIVFFHYPPYSAGGHGNYSPMQWDFRTMGIDVVFAGHDHIYNRIQKIGEESVYYIVNGLGGKEKYNCSDHPISTTLFHSYCYCDDFGAIKAYATQKRLVMKFYSVSLPYQAIDSVEIVK